MRNKRTINKIKQKVDEIELEKVKLDLDKGYFVDEGMLRDEVEMEMSKNVEDRGWEGQDLKPYYSLSRSQGDGLMIEGTLTTDKGVFKVKHKGHYYHEKSKTRDMFQVKYKGKMEYLGDIPEKELEKIDLEKIEAEFNEDYENVCKELAEVGYDYLERLRKDTILMGAWLDFLEKNDIKSDKNYFDFYYSTEPKDDYIQIATAGKTIMDGLWIDIKDEEVEFTDYQAVFTEKELV